MTDEKIKPVAWYDDDLEIHYGPTQPVFTITGWKPLYPESALAQAEEKGRLAGLREAAEMVEMTDLSKVADPSWKLFFADMFIQIAANIRAAEGKK
jgi:hypothetical protein